MNNLIPFFTYVFIVTFTPGPNNIMSMINATNYGYKKTLKFMFGVFSGFFILMVLSSFFNLFLAKSIPKIKPYLKIVGGIYMLYLSYKILMSNKDKDDSKEIKKPLTYYSGLILQIVNVKVILYCLTVVATFILPNYENTLILMLFSFILAFIAFISLNVWAFLGNFFNKYIEKYQKIFNVVMAMLLAYTAFLVSGVAEFF